MRSTRGSLDPVLIGAVVLLLTIGIFMVYSASLVVAFEQFRDDTYFLSRQLIWISIGLMAMFVLAQIDYRVWQRYSIAMLAVVIVLLVAVLIPGVGASSYGSARWLKPIPFIQLQPSELTKLVLVLYMADWLAGKGRRVTEFFTSSLPFLIILTVVCSLVAVEPDFGTTVVIALTAISLFFIAGANLLHFTAGLLASAAVGWVALTSAAYRIQRIEVWFDPWRDIQGSGWHTVQTLIALGSGGLTGLGLGASRQKHFWLVNAHTDAILAIVGEELGLIGTLAVIGLYGVFAWRGLRIAYRANDPYGRLLAAGLTTMIFWQAAINIAVVTNSTPYTGVTLPFVSFGGNSTVVSLAAVGLLLSIARHRSRPARQSAGDTEVEEGPGSASRRSPRGPAAEPVLASVGKLAAPIALRKHSTRSLLGWRRGP